jgi:hypothetical protein
MRICEHVSFDDCTKKQLKTYQVNNITFATHSRTDLAPL